MQVADDGSTRLTLRAAPDTGAGIAPVVAEYVYAPSEPQLESPRPYLLLRTLTGAPATAYRPADHVWHKGFSLALPVVGSANFWGGPTYLHGQGYVQLANNGAQVHRGFVEAPATDADGVVRIDEALDWITEDGRTALVEERRLTARLIDGDAWALTWRSALRNVSGAPLGFGSPTSKGRENAGYAGLFWRGPEAWTGGDIYAPDSSGTGGPVLAGDAARGIPGPWLALVAPDRSSGVLVLDASDPVEPGGNPWFARSEEYAGLNPAPFFYRETTVPDGDTLVLAAVVVIGAAEVATLAPAGQQLVAELRQTTPITTPSNGARS